jgi:uncharacterized protein YaiE (UPF0345 family)
MINKCSVMAILLVSILIIGLTPKSVSADGNRHDTEHAVRLYASERFGPIGMIRETSFAGATAVIDGRAAYGEQKIWGGELIQAPVGKSLRMSFDSIGLVTLAAGAMVRFGRSADDTIRRTLITSLINGGLTMKLDASAGAYVEAAGSTFIASPNAHFRIDMSEGQATLARFSGSVIAEHQAAQARYILRPPAGQGASLSVAARSTRQVQIQVTDENDHPVPDLPILFSLANPCLGSLGVGAGAGLLFKGKTDKRGLASVPWITGAGGCAGSIIAKVEGTDFSFTYQAQVNKHGFFNARNSILLGLVPAGLITFFIVNNNGNNEPIRAVPPPGVKP